MILYRFLCGATAFLALSITTSAAAAEPFFSRYEFGGFAGVKRDLSVFHGGGWGDDFISTGATFDVAIGNLGADGNLHGLSSPRGGGARAAIAGGLRLGWAGERFDLRGGAVLQGTGSAALHWVPSLHARYALGEDRRVALSAGIFDELGYMPGHLSLDVGAFSFGYVGLLGARGAVRIPVSPTLSLQLDAFGFSLGGYQSFMVTLSTLVSKPLPNGGAR